MAERKKILWVEDDSFLNDIIARHLDNANYELVLAKRSEEVFAHLEKEIPALIVLDLMLPGVDGFQIIEKIKADERFRAIPIIVVSNLSQDSDIERTKKLGVVKHLVKAHMNIDEILAEVTAAIGN